MIRCPFRYHVALKTLTENNPRAQLVLLQSLYELWNRHTQVSTVLFSWDRGHWCKECSQKVQWSERPLCFRCSS